MAEPVISLRYDDREIRRKLSDLQERIGDLKPAMQNVGEYLVAAHDRRFDMELDYRGLPLQALSRRTLEQKRRLGRIQKILQSTGLMRSRTSYLATSDRVVVGNNDQKVRKHQLGINVPQRAIFGVNPNEDVPEIIAIFDDFLAG